MARKFDMGNIGVNDEQNKPLDEMVAHIDGYKGFCAAKGTGQINHEGM